MLREDPARCVRCGGALCGTSEKATLELRDGATVAAATVRRLTRAAVAHNRTLGDPTLAARPAPKRDMPRR